MVRKETKKQDGVKRGWFSKIKDKFKREIEDIKEKREQRLIKKHLERLEKGNKRQKRRALKILRKLGKGDKKVIDALVEALGDEYWKVREAAVRALMKQGDLGYILASAWYKKWFEEFGGDYKKAVEMAKNLKGEEREKFIEYLLSDRFIGSEFWDVRRDVCKFIGDVELKDERIVDGLVGALGDEYWKVREAAVRALMKQGDLGYILASAWAKDWFEEFGGDYKKAVEMAKSLKGEEREKFIEYLLSDRFIGSRYWYAKRDICKFIEEVKVKDERIVDGLVKSLKDEDEDVRKAAVEALGELGVVNDEIVDGLVGALGDRDWKVREAAARALGELGVANDKVIDEIVRVLGDKVEDVREAAVEALEHLAEQDEQIKKRVENWKLLLEGLEECDSSKVRVIEELL